MFTIQFHFRSPICDANSQNTNNLANRLDVLRKTGKFFLAEQRFKKSVFLLLFTLNLLQKVIAQNAIPKTIDAAMNVLPPSPQSQNLGKYGDYQVCQYNGVPSIEIPLQNLQTKTGFTLPISLSYHSGGFKVNDIPGLTGMGWTLNAGGAVTRTIRGLDDFGKEGMVHHPVNLDEAFGGNQLLLDQIVSGAYDTQLDLMQLNVAGYSGKFMYNKKDNLICMAPFQNLNIQCRYDPTGAAVNSNVNWTIKDGQGIQFFFDDKELTRTYSQNGTYCNSGGEYCSATYLTRIGLPGDNDIVFTYQDFLFGEHVLSKRSEYGYLCFFSQFGQPLTKEITTSVSSSVNKMKLVSGITYGDYQIQFSYLDLILPNLGSYKALKQIKYKFKGALYKVFECNYRTDNNGRFWLTSVDEKDATLAVLHHTEMNYNWPQDDPNNLPERFSTSQDHWGFCNNNMSQSSVPIVDDSYGSRLSFIVSNEDYSYVMNDVAQSYQTDRERVGIFANKQPDATKMLYGILKSIKNPLSGSTIFEFEPHIYNTSSESRFGGGIRIKSITNRGSDQSFVTKKSFSYEGGLLMSQPEYTYIDAQADCETSTPLWSSYLMSSSDSRIPLSTDAKGSFVGYSKVTEYEEDEQGLRLNGKKEFQYTNIAPSQGSNPVYEWWTFRGQSDYLPNSIHFNENFTANGDLIKETIFKSVGNAYVPVQETQSIYTVKNSWDVHQVSLKSICPSGKPSQTAGTAGFSYESFFDLKLLTRQIVKEFFPDMQGNPTKVVTTDHVYQKLLMSEKINYCQEHQFREKYTFTADNSGHPYYMDSKIIQQEKYKDGTKLSEEQFTYNSTGLLTSIKENPIPFLGNAASNNPLINTPISTAFTYDQNWNIIGVNSTKTPNQALLWDPSLNKPVCKAINCQPDQLAFTSFENGYMGNFSFNQAAVSCVQESQTGSCMFNLSNTNPVTFSLQKPGSYELLLYVDPIGSTQLTSTGISITDSEDQIEGWKVKRFVFTIPTSGSYVFTLNGSAKIDEMRLNPIQASVSSYTYIPFSGVTSIHNERSGVKHFEYDSFGRLVQISDTNKNIQSSINYHLK